MAELCNALMSPQCRLKMLRSVHSVAFQVLYCDMHHNYSKVVISNEILSFEALSNNALTLMKN